MKIDSAAPKAFAASAALMLCAALIFAVLLPPAPELDPQSRYMHAAPDGATPRRPFGLDDPDRYALIVYVNGSTEEGKPDPCDTSRPGINIPRTATDLAGRRVQGYELLVFAFCTRTKVGGFNQPDGDGVPKVVRRAEELRTLLDHIADRGFPRTRVFVMGQSAGAWAGLLVQRADSTAFAGLIGFAPAFAGHHGRRSAAWQAERDRQAAFIGEADRLNALIYGYEQDRFEPVRAMGWLRAVPGVRYVPMTARYQHGFDCGVGAAHGAVFGGCIRYFQRRRILDFIAESLVTPAGA